MQPAKAMIDLFIGRDYSQLFLTITPLWSGYGVPANVKTF